MTENERYAGDEMAKLLVDACGIVKLLDHRCEYESVTEWLVTARAAIKAWEDAKNEDA